MSNRLPAHIIDHATEGRANRTGFHIEQQTVKLYDVNNTRWEWKVVKREQISGLHGSREKCVESIKTLQKRHATHGFNAEMNYWWAHDMPEGAAVPTTRYRWFLA